MSAPSVPPYASLPQVPSEAVKPLWFEGFWDVPESGVARHDERDIYFQLAIRCSSPDGEDRSAYDALLDAPITDEEYERRADAITDAWRAKDPLNRPPRDRYVLSALDEEAARQERWRRSAKNAFGLFQGCEPVWDEATLGPRPEQYPEASASIPRDYADPLLHPWTGLLRRSAGAPLGWCDLTIPTRLRSGGG